MMISKNKYLFLIFNMFFFGAQAEAVEICGKTNQGEILVGYSPQVAKVELNESPILTSEDGSFLIAFGRDEKGVQQLNVTDASGTSTQYSISVNPTQWNIQNIKGVPPRKVTPSDSDLEAIELERKVVRAALKGINTDTYWRTGFIRPIEGRISGQFGGQRILNNIPKSPHQGMDIAAKEGTPVKASSGGEVVLAYPNLFYSGNVVVLDHGFGLQTVYAHLKDINVKRGDKVEQGDIIGTVGQTGRATGPHLHWGASLRNVRFNPQSLLDLNTEKQNCRKL